MKIVASSYQHHVKFQVVTDMSGDISASLFMGV
jgi:hypothetical protein